MPVGNGLMAREAHWVAVDFARWVLRSEARRVRIAAHSSNPVAGHAIGMRSLVMAAGAAHDVVPGCRSVEAWAAWGKPAGWVRIIRVRRGRRQPLGGVTI